MAVNGFCCWAYSIFKITKISVKMTKFEELGLDKTLVEALDKLGIKDATEVQSISIPVILSGKDVVVRSKTGTGKTYAFVLPILNKLIKEPIDGVKAIILSPTRELAMQTYKSIESLKNQNIKAVVVYGGVSINPQISNIKKGCNIVIGTPGRILDIIDRGVLNLNKVKFSVIDEADTMLDMGFIDDMNKILDTAPIDKQTLLFSATIPKALSSVIKGHTNNPEFISVGEDESITVKTIEHTYYITKENRKFQVLLSYLKDMNPGKTIIFSRTKSGANFIQNALKNSGLNVMLMHGGLTQDKREKVLGNFKNFGEILITTDVLSRGIDIKDIETIVNYDIPENPDVYVHRVGRSARMGKSGKAFNIITENEQELIYEIEKRDKIKIKEVDFSIEKYSSLASESIRKTIASSDNRGRRFNGSEGERGRSRTGYRGQSHSRYGSSNNRRSGSSNYVYGGNRNHRSSRSNEDR